MTQQATTKRHAALSGEGENLASHIKYTAKERGGVHVQKRRLSARSKIGADWDGTAANDNIAWPLATALIREGNMELLKAAIAYRKLNDEANSSAMLGGTSPEIASGYKLDRTTWVRASGGIATKVRKLESMDAPATMRVSPFEDEDTLVQKNSVKIPKPWNGDAPVNSMIDAQRRLGELRERLGILVEPMEMAVVDGETYQSVGNASGVSDRSGSIAAGRAIVHMALISLRDFIGNVKRSDIDA